MSVVYVLTPVALLLVIAAAVAFVWAARQGQWDDTTTPAWRALHDDPPAGRTPEDREVPPPPAKRP
jgi:cbb3-type cytochrome oxidase maturation protein